MNIKNFFPIIEWVSNYNKAWLKGDVSAGITVGIMLIPQGIAYALIAEIPPIYGLYTAMIPQLIYAIFGTSRQLAVGPAAMDSLIVAAGVATIADIGTENFVAFAILLAFMTGMLQVLFGLFRLGFLVNFLSKPVISGFTSAAYLIIGLSQFNHLLGIHLERNSKLQNIIAEIGRHVVEVHWLTFLIGLVSIVIIIIIKKYFKKVPSALVVVVLGIILAKFLHIDQYGVKILGDIPKGFPEFKMPVFDQDIMIKLFPIALTLSFIAFLEAITIAKSVELKHTEYKVIPSQELIAIGMGNIVGSFFQTYPATASFSRTAVNDQTGAKTPLAAIVSAIMVAITLLFLTPVFYYLPKAVLAAIIMVAVLGLLDFNVPKQLLKYAKRDFIILILTLFATAMIGVKVGIIVGVLLSLGMFVYKSTKPHIAVLGQVPDTHFYRNIARFDDLIVDNKILIVRFDSQLHFTNTTYFKDKLQEFAALKGNDLEVLIIDGESFANLDSSAVYALDELLDYFQSKSIKVLFTGLKGPVRDVVKKSGLINKIGYNHCFMSTQEAVDSCNSKSEISDNKYKFQKFIE